MGSVVIVQKTSAKNYMRVEVLKRDHNFTHTEYSFKFRITDPLTVFEGVVFIRAVEFSQPLSELSDDTIVEAILHHLGRYAVFAHADLG